ncbi:MAG: hypothetical protein IPG63_07610 [Xanthomonadales bacterium]|nr:hypothetical protein [Xanthomonadales bacterium]
MSSDEALLTLRIEGTAYAVSMRRTYEHHEYRQAWPFPAADDGVDDPAVVVDIVRFDHDHEHLAGYTLAQLLREDDPSPIRRFLRERAQQMPRLQPWLRGFGQWLQERRSRRGLRNRPERFLPTDPAAPFRLVGLRSALLDALEAQGEVRQSASAWVGRLRNWPGLRQDERDALDIDAVLASLPADAGISGPDLRALVDIGALRLSVIPVTVTGTTQLDLRPVHVDLWRRLPRARKRRIKDVVELLRDRSLGYSLERRCWDDLFGPMEIWRAFDHRGDPVRTRAFPRGDYPNRTEAIRAAQRHAAKIYPKLSTRGRWSHHRLTGGARYREWLVTLPWYPPGYFSSHFEQRNVLLHVRCDARESPDGERVLFLQEIQSDWAQQARREARQGTLATPTPPWCDEWPALALKLMLLHAVAQGFDALAWSTGEEQVRRWDGLGAPGLRELYDRTLPREAKRMLKPFGRDVEPIAFYRPVNFTIEPTEDGYLVLDDTGEVRAECKQRQEVAAAIPCGGLEDAVTKPGIRIDADLRGALRERGLCAWGNAILKSSS